MGKDKTPYDIFLETIEEAMPDRIAKDECENRLIDVARPKKGIWLRNFGAIVFKKNEETPDSRDKEAMKVWRDKEFDTMGKIEDLLLSTGYAPTKGSNRILQERDEFRGPYSSVLFYDVPIDEHDLTPSEGEEQYDGLCLERFDKITVGFRKTRFSHILEPRISSMF